MDGAKAALREKACIEAGSYFCVALKPQADCVFIYENLLFLEAAKILPSAG
jgi:hypothetical protein